MKIVAHRGYWSTPSEKNTFYAFERALKGGFGIETDVRDAGGCMVISHDIPSGGEMSIDAFLMLCRHHPSARPLALNIKSDGLQVLVQTALTLHGIEDAFVFDMAVPDALGYLARGLPTYTRCSEYENSPSFAARAAGIWLDAFHGEWYDLKLIDSWLAQDKAVCIVSPELHGRPHQAFWQRLFDAGFQHQPALSICTDYPLEAKEFFRGKN